MSKIYFRLNVEDCHIQQQISLAVHDNLPPTATSSSNVYKEAEKFDIEMIYITWCLGIGYLAGPAQNSLLCKFATNHENIRQEMTGNDRAWQEMTGNDRKWQETTGNDREWQDCSV